MGGKPEPEAWAAYRAATGRAVPAVHRRTWWQRVGFAVLGLALLAAAAVMAYALDGRGARRGGPALLAGLGLAALFLAVQRPGPLPLPLPGSRPGNPLACPTCGGPTTWRDGRDGERLAACAACGLARPVDAVLPECS